MEWACKHLLIDINDLAQGELAKWIAHQQEVFQWCQDNSKHLVRLHGSYLYFESEEDYTMFVLKWA